MTAPIFRKRILCIVLLFVGCCVPRLSVAYDPVHVEIARQFLSGFLDGKSFEDSYKVVRSDPVMGPRLAGFENRVLDVYQTLSVNPSLVNPGRNMAVVLDIPVEYGNALVLFYDLTGSLDLNLYENQLILAQARRQLFREAHHDRIVYYQSNITRLSVPEMAVVLGMTELDVYHQLWMLGISIEDVWDRSRLSDGDFVMSRVRALLSQGYGVAAVSDQLGLGQDALSNILSYKGLVVKSGEAWGDIEVQTLVTWYGMATIGDLRAMLDRTEASIWHKASKLGLTRPTQIRGDPNLTIAGFGAIKVNGRFDPSVLEAYLRLNILRSNQELAVTLGCAPTTIAQWRKRLGLESTRFPRPNRSKSPRRGDLASLGGNRFQNQATLISRAVDRFERCGVMPKLDNANETLGMNWYKATGTARYRMGDAGSGKAAGEYAHQRIFGSTADFWLAFGLGVSRRRAQLLAEGRTSTSAYHHLSSFSPFLIKLNKQDGELPARAHTLFDAYRPMEQKRRIAFAVDRFQESGQLPASRNHKKTLGIDWDRVVGGDDYHPGDPSRGRPAGRKAHFRIFDDTATFWVAFEREVAKRIRDLTHAGESSSECFRHLVSFRPTSVKWEQHTLQRPEIVEMFDRYRQMARQELVVFAFDRFEKNGAAAESKKCNDNTRHEMGQSHGVSSI